MNRRGFLGALFGGLALDPERALWIPGRKLISIPKPAIIGFLPRIKIGDTIHIRKPYRYRMSAGQSINEAYRSLEVLGFSPPDITTQAQELAYREMNAMLDHWRDDFFRHELMVPSA